MTPNVLTHEHRTTAPDLALAEGPPTTELNLRGVDASAVVALPEGVHASKETVIAAAREVVTLLRNGGEPGEAGPKDSPLAKEAKPKEASNSGDNVPDYIKAFRSGMDSIKADADAARKKLEAEHPTYWPEAETQTAAAIVSETPATESTPEPTSLTAPDLVEFAEPTPLEAPEGVSIAEPSVIGWGAEPAPAGEVFMPDYDPAEMARDAYAEPELGDLVDATLNTGADEGILDQQLAERYAADTNENAKDIDEPLAQAYKEIEANTEAKRLERQTESAYLTSLGKRQRHLAPKPESPKGLARIKAINPFARKKVLQSGPETTSQPVERVVFDDVPFSLDQHRPEWRIARGNARDSKRHEYLTDQRPKVRFARVAARLALVAATVGAGGAAAHNLAGAIEQATTPDSAATEVSNAMDPANFTDPNRGGILGSLNALARVNAQQSEVDYTGAPLIKETVTTDKSTGTDVTRFDNLATGDTMFVADGVDGNGDAVYSAMVEKGTSGGSSQVAYVMTQDGDNGYIATPVTVPPMADPAATVAAALDEALED